MRIAQGGTRLYCPECRDISVCKAINPSYIVDVSGQRWESTIYNDINWFRRGRQCLECGHEFLTAEIEEDFVTELIELRNALAEIKKNAEAYSKESAAAATSLEKLSKSLNVLRALKIYKRT